MLDWMRGVLGRKGSPLRALVEKAYKDDAEKLALLEAILTDDSAKAEELLPLALSDDPVIAQRVAPVFLSRADEKTMGVVLEEAVHAEATRRTAAIALLSRKVALLAPHISDMLGRKGSADEKRPLWALVMDLPPEAGDPHLERALKEGPPQARARAITRLVKTRKIEDLREQLLVLAADRDTGVRRAAVEGLLKLSGKDVFDAFLDRLSSETEADIRKSAGGYLQRFIASAPSELRPAILGKLLLNGDAALQAELLKALLSAANIDETLLEILTFCKTLLGAQHLAVMDALKGLGDPLLAAGMKMLGNSDPAIRVQALLLVERFARPKTAGNIARLLKDDDWWVRIMACETLGRLKDPAATDAIKAMLSDPDCKWSAIDALASLGGEGSLGTLAALLKQPDAETRMAVTSSFSNLEDPRAVGILTELVKSDPSMDVRVRASDVLREKSGAAGPAGATVKSGELSRPMDKLLAYAREANASDLHIAPGEPPILRVNGVLRRLEMKPFTGTQIEGLCEDLMNPARRASLDKTGAVEFCYSITGVGRYRSSVFRHQRGLSGAFRAVPNVAPRFSTLGLPKHLDQISTYHQGVVLLVGPAGAGKSTTLTALVNTINESKPSHVLTLEDPIEFLHTPKRALINQREIGRDSLTFAAAMRGALREDPDVIVVGELRDRETIRLALVAAETGHLVIGTMQTTGAVATIDKLVESFPADEQQQVRVSLSGSLKLVVSQVLVPRADGQGRAAVFEILKSTSGIRNTIREGKTFQLPSAMQTGRGEGMQTVDSALEELVAAGTITVETAFMAAQKKDQFDKRKIAAAGAAAAAAGGKPQPAAAPSAPQSEPRLKPAQPALPAQPNMQATPAQPAPAQQAPAQQQPAQPAQPAQQGHPTSARMRASRPPRRASIPVAGAPQSAGRQRSRPPSGAADPRASVPKQAAAAAAAPVRARPAVVPRDDDDAPAPQAGPRKDRR